MEHVACTIGGVCILAENKDLLAAIASVIVAGTFILGLWQYRRTQVWKRNEFLASEMEKFFNDQDVIDVEGMLDYTGKSFVHGEADDKITIFVYHSSEHIPLDKGREFFVDLNVSLQYHEEGDQSDVDIIIRRKIDSYFAYIQRFATFVRNNLFTVKEIFPYLEYQVSLINGCRDHSAGYHKALYSYLILYDFDRAVTFLGNFPRADFVQTYIDEARRRKATIRSVPLTEERVANYRRRLFGRQL